jgi:signal transduction histidine kinase
MILLVVPGVTAASILGFVSYLLVSYAIFFPAAIPYSA